MPSAVDGDSLVLSSPSSRRPSRLSTRSRSSSYSRSSCQAGDPDDAGTYFRERSPAVPAAPGVVSDASSWLDGNHFTSSGTCRPRPIPPGTCHDVMADGSMAGDSKGDILVDGGCAATVAWPQMGRRRGERRRRWGRTRGGRPCGMCVDRPCVVRQRCVR